MKLPKQLTPIPLSAMDAQRIAKLYQLVSQPQLPPPVVPVVVCSGGT